MILSCRHVAIPSCICPGAAASVRRQALSDNDRSRVGTACKGTPLPTLQAGSFSRRITPSFFAVPSPIMGPRSARLRDIQTGRKTMNRRNILNLSAAAVLALAFATSPAVGQQKTLKEQLAGAWTLAAFESFDAAGAKIPNMEGSDLKGLLILTDSGRLSVQMIAAFPTIASKDRLKTTPAEDKAVAHGVLSYFGTYTVSEADKAISCQTEAFGAATQPAGTV